MEPAIILVLFLSTLIPVFTVGAAHASTGTAQLGSVNSVPRPTSLSVASNNESVIAGTTEVVSADGIDLSPPGVFAISFTGIIFSGSEFRLYMSTDGFSNVESTDVQYGPKFNTADFRNATDTWKSITGNIGLGETGTFYIGTTESGTRVVAGPIPIDISSAYNFVKIFDGSSGAVASTRGVIDPQPGIAGIHLGSLSGAAGTPVSVSGGAFPPGITVNINITYSTHPWLGGNKNRTTTTTWIRGIPTGTGYFAAGCDSSGKYAAGTTCPMIDTKQVINPMAPFGPYTTVPILILVVNASNPKQVLNPEQNSIGSPVFKEFSRGIAMVTSYDSAGNPVDVTDGAFVLGQLYGNDTGTEGTVGSTTVKGLPPVDAKVFGTLYIAGNFSYVGKPVTFWIGSRLSKAIQMTTASPVIPDAQGFWNATVTIPAVSGGSQTVWILNDGVDYSTYNTVSGSVTTTTTTSSTTTSSTTTTTTSSTTTSSTTTTTTSSTTTSSTTTTTTSSASPTTTTHSSTTTSVSSVASTATSSSSTHLSSTTTITTTTTTTSYSSSTITSNRAGISEFTFFTAVIATLAGVFVLVYILLERSGRPPNLKTRPPTDPRASDPGLSTASSGTPSHSQIEKPRRL